MPKIEIEGHGSVDAAAGTRLVKAIMEAGVDVGHRCGGYAKCTTCRVQFLEGEPAEMTRAERDKLAEKGLLGQVRLSCQVPTDHPMKVRPLMLASEQGWPDAGPEPADEITPEPEWVERPGA